MISKIDLPGTCFRVVFIPANEEPEEHHGSKEPEDIIEFYDRDYKHTPDGQFIARYYADTLLKDKAALNYGLDLMGYVPKWKIRGNPMKFLLTWIQTCATPEQDFRQC